MTIFTGTILGQAISRREADSPTDLYLELSNDPSTDSVPDSVRCWVLMTTKSGRSLWIEVDLADPNHFDLTCKAGLGALGDVVELKIEDEAENSPNAFGTPEPAVEKVHLIPVLKAGSPTKKKTSKSSPSQCAISSRDDIINDVEPFTQCELEEVDDLIFLEFLKPKSIDYVIVAVSLDGLKQFAKYKNVGGSKLCDLKLEKVHCRDGKERDFVLTALVWVQSILEHSKTLRKMYYQNTTSALARQQQLERMKTDLPDLHAMIMFWINDMLSFASNPQARERLEVPTRVEDDVPPFFNEVYFSSEEAKYVAKQTLPSGDSLGTAFQALLDDRASAGSTEVCTSHDLAPFLRDALDIPSHFYKSEGFKKNYKAFEKEWKKKQKKLAKRRGP